MLRKPVICLECRCVYRPVATALAVVQEGACPQCGYVGWKPAPPSTRVYDRPELDPLHVLLRRVVGQRGDSVEESPVARAG